MYKKTKRIKMKRRGVEAGRYQPGVKENVNKADNRICKMV